MSNSYDRNKSQRKPQENPAIANMSKEQMQKLMRNIGGLGIHGGPRKPQTAAQNAQKNRRRNFGSNIMNRDRFMKDPKKAFAALAKHSGKMSPEQQQQLQSSISGMLGQDLSGLGGAGKAADAFGNLSTEKENKSSAQWRKERDPSYRGASPAVLQKTSEQNNVTGGIAGLLDKLGVTNQVAGGISPGMNLKTMQPGQPPTRSTLMPQAPPPQLNLGGIQGGAMGMGGQQPARRGPLDSGNYGGLPGAPGAQTNQPKGTSPPGGTPPKTLASFAGVEQSKVPPTATSANTTPTTSPPTGMSAQGAAASLGGGVNTNQLQNAVAGSAAINSPVNNAQAMFQGTYGDLINMPGQGEVANQFSTPGMSMVGGQYGQGGLAANQMQKMANDATTTGLQNRQQMIGQNINQGMAAGQMASQMDMGQRQQVIGHLGTMLGPALSGVTQGFQSGVGGLTTNI